MMEFRIVDFQVHIAQAHIKKSKHEWKIQIVEMTLLDVCAMYWTSNKIIAT